jgi:hypothetical protein
MNTLQLLPSDVDELVDDEPMEVVLPFDEAVIEQIRKDLSDLCIVPFRYLCTVSSKMLRFHPF